MNIGEKNLPWVVIRILFDTAIRPCWRKRDSACRLIAVPAHWSSSETPRTASECLFVWCQVFLSTLDCDSSLLSRSRPPFHYNDKGNNRFNLKLDAFAVAGVAWGGIFAQVRVCIRATVTARNKSQRGRVLVCMGVWQVLSCVRCDGSVASGWTFSHPDRCQSLRHVPESHMPWLKPQILMLRGCQLIISLPGIHTFHLSQQWIRFFLPFLRLVLIKPFDRRLWLIDAPPQPHIYVSVCVCVCIDTTSVFSDTSELSIFVSISVGRWRQTSGRSVRTHTRARPRRLPWLPESSLSLWRPSEWWQHWHLSPRTYTHTHTPHPTASVNHPTSSVRLHYLTHIIFSPPSSPWCEERYREAENGWRLLVRISRQMRRRCGRPLDNFES